MDFGLFAAAGGPILWIGDRDSPVQGCYFLSLNCRIRLYGTKSE